MKKVIYFLLILFGGLHISCFTPAAWAQGNQGNGSSSDTTQQDSTINVGPVQIQIRIDTSKAATTKADTAKADSSLAETADNTIKRVRNLISFGVILTILLILVLTYFINKLLGQVISNLAERTSKRRLMIKRMIPVIRITLWVFALYVIIKGVIDPSLETIITVAASIGIAVGLASQNILQNIFGGIIIVLDRPFQVGDKIEVGEYYGEVLQIGLRATRIVTPDDSVVSVPNGEIQSKAVSNANSGELDCQVVAEIFLPADIDIDLVKRIAYKAAFSSRYVFLKKPVVIIAKNEIHEKNFVVKLRVKAYVLDIRYEFPFQSEMTELVLTELNRRKLLPRNMESVG